MEKGIIGKPKFKRDDIVKFEVHDEVKTGRVYIVDAYGTWGQIEEPSYDVMIDEENCLYKHIRESQLLE